ncbi:MAG TPA: hypothetical protein VNJ02_17810 [Vicinamibacterales bacterium]|nr:hypothetical protein [Vicinamibacterales bacterium]
MSGVGDWDSGRRCNRHAEAELQRVETRNLRLQDVKKRLYRRHGTHWPEDIRDRFLAEQGSVQQRLSELQDDQWEGEPWFPERLISAVDDELLHLERADQRFRPLLQALWAALERLVQHRKDGRTGQHGLNQSQRNKLQKLSRAVRATIKNSGTGIQATQDLIGNWAHGLLHGQSFVDIVRALIVLDVELQERLSQSSLRGAHRPTDVALSRFFDDVVLALHDAGEKCTATTDGVVARIASILLEAAGHRCPKDSRRLISASIRRRPRLDAVRAERQRIWASFLNSSAPPAATKARKKAR